MKFNKILLSCVAAGVVSLPVATAQAWWGYGPGYPGWGGYYPYGGYGVPYAPPAAAPQHETAINK